MGSLETNPLPEEQPTVPPTERILTKGLPEQFQTQPLNKQDSIAEQQAREFLARKAGDRYKTSDLSPAAEAYRQKLNPGLQYPEVRNDADILELKQNLADLQQRAREGRDIRPQPAEVSRDAVNFYNRLMDPKSNELLQFTPEQRQWVAEKEQEAQIAAVRQEIEQIPD